MNDGSRSQDMNPNSAPEGGSMGEQEQAQPQAAMGHILADISAFDTETVSRLAGQWVTTAEELVAACATDEGRQGMCRLLDCDSEALELLLHHAEAVLSEETVARLRAPADLRPMGLRIDEPSKLGEVSGEEPNA